MAAADDLDTFRRRVQRTRRELDDVRPADGEALAPSRAPRPGGAQGRLPRLAGSRRARLAAPLALGFLAGTLVGAGAAPVARRLAG